MNQNLTNDIISIVITTYKLNRIDEYFFWRSDGNSTKINYQN